jgi:hypothetical protein
MENEEEKFEAQFHNSKFETVVIKGKSIKELKRRLSKMDVLASAYIYEIGNSHENHCYYRPMYHNRKDQS